MEINLKTEQRKLVKNLDTIFKAPSMKMAFAQPNMQTIIEKQLNILGFLERTNASKTIKSSNFLATYNQLANKHFVIDKNISFNDYELLADDINYLSIYVKNIYKIDLQALADGKEATVVTPTVTDAQPPNNPMASMFPFMMGGTNGSLEQNPMATAMANMRVRQEAAANRVYLYKNKPLIIPVLKWVMVIALLLCACASIFVGIGMVTSAGSSYLNQTLQDSSGLSSESIMYFIFGLLVLFNAYTIMYPLLSRNTKKANDNQYYYFQLRNFFFVGLMFIFVVIFGLAMGDRYIFFSSASPWNNHDSAHAFGLWAAYIGYILLLISFGIAIVCVIIASTMNPKIDAERLEALTRQYLDEMTRKGPPPPSQGVAS